MTIYTLLFNSPVVLSSFYYLLSLRFEKHGQCLIISLRIKLKFYEFSQVTVHEQKKDLYLNFDNNLYWGFYVISLLSFLTNDKHKLRKCVCIKSY
jgi:hypothetical protein